MDRTRPENKTPKISAQFAARLNRLRAGQKVQAIVMVQTGTASCGAAGRKGRAQRQAEAKSTRESAEPALAEIDAILKRHRGKRLAPEVNALGCVPVETTADGVRAIASSDLVKAVLEDQQISLLR